MLPIRTYYILSDDRRSKLFAFYSNVCYQRYPRVIASVGLVIKDYV
jgi:hypothetical protein